jgi:E3 ubiquitin-protein ligase TRIP12
VLTFPSNTKVHFLDGVFDHKAYTEKSLARMVKAKAKADRVAARQVAQTPTSVSVPAASTSAEVATPVADGETSTPAPTSEQTSQEAEEGISTSNTAPTKEALPDRTELLRSKPLVVGRFVQLLVPILIDVYAASVVTPIRVKTLTGLLKAVSFLDTDGIKQVFLVSCSLLALSIEDVNFHS